MRVISAAVFVFALMLGLAGLASYLNLFLYPRITGIAIGILTLLGCLGALALFNKRGSDFFGQTIPEEHLHDLESQELLLDEDFVALRAFEVEEFEDEGMHFFVELQDERVLFLSGQYLYDYEPINARNGLKPRRFPCSEFTVRRHKDKNYVADLICRGKVLEPESLAPPFTDQEWREDKVPSDGEIITRISFDQLKKQRHIVQLRR
jgi:hypothetical protein